MKRLLACVLCLCLCLSFAGCTSAGEEVPETDRPDASAPESVSESEPEPELPPPPPPYEPEYLTGRERGEDYNEYRRVTAVMINNIAACRPQRGISQADILFESKVEGGITRFMALFPDYTKLEGDIGPVRSGRDQFLRWAIPFDAMYMHVGRSGITQTYIDQHEYNDRDVDGQYKIFTAYDEARRQAGYSREHTAFTTAERITKVLDDNGYSMERTYKGGCFDFVPYDENGGVRELTGESATSVRIQHSASYLTDFDFDPATGKLMMSQWDSHDGLWRDTVDENNGVHLGFDNVFVCFADIYTYPYPGGNLDANGNDKGDPNYQCVDMDYGGLGFYFSGGRVEPIRWFKGAPTDPLRFTDMDENSLKVNCGTSYIGFVDLDEYEKFSYAGEDAAPVEGGGEVNTDQAEIGE